VILRDSGLTYAGLFRLKETAADLLAKHLANSYRPPTLCELVNDGLRTLAYWWQSGEPENEAPEQLNRLSALETPWKPGDRSSLSLIRNYHQFHSVFALDSAAGRGLD
jgi:hypothetical protein